MLFKVIRHRFRYVSTARMQLAISELENVAIANALQLEAAQRRAVHPL